MVVGDCRDLYFLDLNPCRVYKGISSDYQVWVHLALRIYFKYTFMVGVV